MSKPVTKEPENKGAPAVLGIASDFELKARAEISRIQDSLAAARTRQLEDRPEDDGKDWGKQIAFLREQLDDAKKDWKTFADMVFRGDKQVDPSKRSAEETITRDEGANLVRMLLIHLRTGMERYKEIVPQIMECRTPEDGYALVEKEFAGKFEAAIDLGVRESHLPEWVAEAAKSIIPWTL